MRARSIFPLLSIASLALATAACAMDSNDDTDSTEGAKTIEPTDDENLGYVQALAPTNATIDTVSHVVASYRGPDNGTANLIVGQPLRTKPGSGRVTVNGGLVTTSTGVTVTEAKTTDVTLAGVNLQVDMSHLEVDFGRQAIYGITWTNDLGVKESGNVHAPGSFLLLPGAYTFSFGTDKPGLGLAALSPVNKSFPAGVMTTADVTPPDVRATLAIKQPSRDFPDAVPGNQGVSYPNCHHNPQVLVMRADQTSSNWHNGSLHASTSIATTADRDVRVFPFVASEAPEHYELVVNNIPMQVDATAGKTTDVEVQRLDVDDVNVTTETGEQKKIPGTYQLYRQVAQSWVPVEISDKGAGCDNIASSSYAVFRTKTGIDVPPGSYKVVVTYSTAAEANKSKEYVVSVP